MAQRFARRLEPWISPARMEAHRPAHGDDLDMLVVYLYNMMLCESLYNPLGFLEVALRNSLHRSLSELHGSPSWYSLPGVLERYQTHEVASVSRRFAGEGKAVTADRIVSELNLGFWVALLSTPYDARFWRPQKAHFLKVSFPHVPKHQRQRPVIYKRLNELRLLRNRVFHHETIWNRVTLARDYDRLGEVLGWTSPEMRDACRLIDRFPDVYRSGRGALEPLLKHHLEVD